MSNVVLRNEVMSTHHRQRTAEPHWKLCGTWNVDASLSWLHSHSGNDLLAFVLCCFYSEPVSNRENSTTSCRDHSWECLYLCVVWNWRMGKSLVFTGVNTSIRLLGSGPPLFSTLRLACFWAPPPVFRNAYMLYTLVCITSTISVSRSPASICHCQTLQSQCSQSPPT